MSSSSADNPGFESTPGMTALVTGSSGLVGARLVEMLLHRGAKHVLALDIVPPSPELRRRFDQAAATHPQFENRYKIYTGDLTDPSVVQSICTPSPENKNIKIDIIYHIAALVGPFHDRSKYLAVNYHGTLHLLQACRNNHIPYFIFSSSPSTRFTGVDITGQTEDQLPIVSKFLALYAETKAMAEIKVTEANNPPNFYATSIAPHQVYGPYDGLFLPNLLETMGTKRLRIFGNGENLISVCFNDNYCHGLMCGADALVRQRHWDELQNAAGTSGKNKNEIPPPPPHVAGKFYIITDGPPQKFWSIINQAGTFMGFADMTQKFHLPKWLLMGVAYVCNAIGWMLGKKLKLNPFNVKMLTMHRYFSIENASRDLRYQPVKEFEEAWGETLEWFKVHWLPGFLESGRNVGFDFDREKQGGKKGENGSKKQQ